MGDSDLCSPLSDVGLGAWAWLVVNEDDLSGLGASCDSASVHVLSNQKSLSDDSSLDDLNSSDVS